MHMLNSAAWQGPRAERRQHDRRAPLELVAVGFAGQNGGLLVDLCEDGLAVQAVRPLTPGSECPLRFELPTTGPPIETTGRVVWADPNGRAGLRLALAPEQRFRVQRWLEMQEGSGAPVAGPPRASSPIWTPEDIDAAENRPLRPREQTPLPAAAVDGAAALARLPALIAAQRLTLDAALQLVCERTRMLTLATGAAVALRSGDAMLCRASSGLAPDVGVPVQMDSGLSGACLRSGEVIRCDDTEDDERVNREACRALSLRSAMLVPLRAAEGDILGLLEVFSDRPRVFGDAELRTLQAAARLIVETIASPSSAANSPAAEPAPARAATAAAPQSTTPELIPGLPLLGEVPRAAAPAAPLAPPAPRRQTAPPEAEPEAAAAAPAPTGRVTATAAPLPAAAPARQPAIEVQRTVTLPRPALRHDAATAMKQRLIVGSILALLLITAALLYWWPATAEPAPPLATSAPVPPPELVAPPAETGVPAPAHAEQRPQPAASPGPRSPGAPTPAAQRGAVSSGEPETSAVIVTRANIPLREPDSAAEPALASSAVPPPTVLISSVQNPALDAVTSVPTSTPSLSAALPVSRVEPARLVQRVQPVYPAPARSSGIQGAVVLDATIARDGSVRDLQLISGHPLLVQAAMEAVRRWRYSPSLLNGQPVEASARVTIEFKLPSGR